MTTKTQLLLSLLLFCNAFLFSQSGGADQCINAEPLCGSEEFSYPSGTSGGSAEVGPDYGCLASTPNPAWFFLQIAQSGNVTLRIEQSETPGGPPSIDVDFIIYGPFSDTSVACSSALTFSNIVDCSYSPNAIEVVNIPNANAGDLYLLLITNFDGDPGFITVEQSGGTGSTNCGILADEIGCEGEVISLDATTSGADNYVWYQDDGFGNFVIIPGESAGVLNVTSSDVYRCEAYDVTDNLLENYQFKAA